MHISLVVFVSLLPCYFCQLGSHSLQNDPSDAYCTNVPCGQNQECRVLKSCGEKNRCNLTAICIPRGNLDREYCRSGKAIVTRDSNNSLDYLGCHTNAPCPTNAYCSTRIQDAETVCCLSDTALTVHDGECPNIPSNPKQFWCVDECKNDGDCYQGEKCCFTECSRQCTQSVIKPPPVPTYTVPPPPLLPVERPVDICAISLCATDMECRLVKPCGEMEQCNLTATCLPKGVLGRPSCKSGKAIVTRDSNNSPDYLGCHTKAPCPTNAYCSTVLQDVGAVCCLSDTALTVHDGECPNIPFDSKRFWCVDECKSDGDCYYGDKCCFSGCSKQCTRPVLKPPPIPPSTDNLPPVDPCQNKVCPPTHYCRKPEMSCYTPWNCASVGECIPCEPVMNIHPRFGFKVVSRSNGCPMLQPFKSAPEHLFHRNNPMSHFLMWLYQYEQK